MSSKEKWYSSAALIVGVVILYLLLHKTGIVQPGGTVINVPQLPAPIYSPVNYTVNASQGGTPNGSPPTMATCGCSDSGGGGLFASINDMIKNLTGQETAIEESYFAGVLNSLPTWFSQNLNNEQGAYTSGQSVSTFLSL